MKYMKFEVMIGKQLIEFMYWVVIYELYIYNSTQNRFYKVKIIPTYILWIGLIFS